MLYKDKFTQERDERQAANVSPGRKHQTVGKSVHQAGLAPSTARPPAALLGSPLARRCSRLWVCGAWRSALERSAESSVALWHFYGTPELPGPGGAQRGRRGTAAGPVVMNSQGSPQPAVPSPSLPGVRALAEGGIAPQDGEPAWGCSGAGAVQGCPGSGEVGVSPRHAAARDPCPACRPCLVGVPAARREE